MIVATAGHIDHGKTLLVKTLTGVDTDRLPEEKARGISIDLGFAYWPLESGNVIGFVDVPGHERFIRNMLAGVCGIDFAHAGEHVVDEAFVAGHVDEADQLVIAERPVGEAQIDRDAARLFLGQAVGVDARQRLHQQRLAVVDVACGGDDHLKTLPQRRKVKKQIRQ